ncbi:MAG: ribonuclease HIII [Verrucomicrobiae bacterium]|nr:ribonuclease HIII [Verrucomicrobiae bacterium]
MNPLTCFSIKLTDAQARLVERQLREGGFASQSTPHARFAGRKEGLTVVFYESGKLVVQGQATRDFVQFFLEPEVLGEARLGYEEQLNPRAFEPHMGVDESGKGDYFGPLVVSAVFATAEAIRAFRETGVRDSKNVSSDARALELDRVVRKTSGCTAVTVPIGPAAYNRLHAKMRTVNQVLGWGHARALENALERVDPKGSGTVCVRAISDQFGKKETVLRALLARGKRLELEQRPRAEEDLVVAAASLVARAEFLLALRRMARRWQVEFPKGASERVVAAGREFVRKHGAEKLGEVAKLHFRTTAEVTAPT